MVRAWKDGQVSRMATPAPDPRAAPFHISNALNRGRFLIHPARFSFLTSEKNVTIGDVWAEFNLL